MKKILLLLPLLVLAINTNAQTKFGVKGGMNVANLTGDIEENKSKIGFYAGAYATIKIDDKFAFQPEVLYSAQGTKTKYEDSYYLPEYGNVNVKAEEKLNLDYINLPLMFKYYANESLFLEAGPQVGFLINSKIKTEIDVEGNKVEEKIDYNDYLKSVDFSLNVGLGYELTNGINFGARYNFGLSNIADSDVKLKNSVFSFGVGYSFK